MTQNDIDQFVAGIIGLCSQLIKRLQRIGMDSRCNYAGTVISAPLDSERSLLMIDYPPFCYI